MKNIEPKISLDLILNLIKENNITAYEIDKNSDLTAVGVQKIIDGKTKKPNQSTINTIYNYITYKKKSKTNDNSYITNEFEYKNNTTGVPYYENMEVAGSITSMYSDFKEVPTFYINYEHFNDCTAYLPVVGDSMYPQYCSGEIVAVKKIINYNALLWGEAYFIVTNENANDLKTIKLLFSHEDDSKLILRAS